MREIHLQPGVAGPEVEADATGPELAEGAQVLGHEPLKRQRFDLGGDVERAPGAQRTKHPASNT